jgi:glutamine synthetase
LKVRPASYKAQLDLLNSVSTHINELNINVEKMMALKEKADSAKTAHERSVFYCDKVKPVFDVIRNHADQLEVICDDSIWSLPKYREILFVK